MAAEGPHGCFPYQKACNIEVDAKASLHPAVLAPEILAGGTQSPSVLGIVDITILVLRHGCAPQDFQTCIGSSPADLPPCHMAVVDCHNGLVIRQSKVVKHHLAVRSELTGYTPCNTVKHLKIIFYKPHESVSLQALIFQLLLIQIQEQVFLLRTFLLSLCTKRQSLPLPGQLRLQE